jgi:hypothetical protein
MNAAKRNIFASGVPTAPDVRKLHEQFGVPKEGTVVSNEELEECIRVDRKSFRFKTVFGSWRKRLAKDHNVLLVAIAGEGYKVADPTERINWCASKARHGRKAIVVAATVADATDTRRLTMDQQVVRTQVMSGITMLQQAAQLAPRKPKQIT